MTKGVPSFEVYASVLSFQLSANSHTMCILRNVLTVTVLLFFATGSYHLYRMFMADYYITQAREIEKGKEWNTAILAYRKAIEYASGGNPEYHFLFGKFYLRFAREANDGVLKAMLLQSAWCELEEARKGSPKEAHTYLALAQTSEAMSHLDPTNLYPVKCDSYLTGATNTIDSNAEEYYRTAVSLYPNSTQYRYLFARYCKRAGKPDEALRQVKTMIALDPTTNRYIRSNRFWQMPGIEEAVEGGLRQALDNRFVRNSAAGVLASLLAAKEKWLEAACVYKQAMPDGVFADPTTYYLTMGQYLLRGGEYSKAEAYFLIGVRAASERAAVIRRFTGEYMRVGKFYELFGLFEKLKKRHPEVIEVDLYWAQGLYKEKKYQEALFYLESFLKRKETAEVDYWMAMTCEKLEQPYRAETHIKRAIKWEPGSALYHHFYAGLLYNAWRFAEALEEADAAVLASDNKNPWYLDRKAWILYRMKRYEESIETWELTASLKPGHKAFSRNIDMAKKARDAS